MTTPSEIGSGRRSALGTLSPIHQEAFARLATFDPLSWTASPNIKIPKPPERTVSSSLELGSCSKRSVQRYQPDSDFPESPLRNSLQTQGERLKQREEVFRSMENLFTGEKTSPLFFSEEDIKNMQEHRTKKNEFYAEETQTRDEIKREFSQETRQLFCKAEEIEREAL